MASRVERSVLLASGGERNESSAPGNPRYLYFSFSPSLPPPLSLSTLDLREPLSPPATLSPPPPPPLFSSSPPDAREVDLFHVEREGGGFDSPRECAKKRVNKSDTRPPPLFTRLPSRATGKGRDGEREERVRDRIVLFDCGLFSPLSQGFSFEGGKGWYLGERDFFGREFR